MLLSSQSPSYAQTAEIRGEISAWTYLRESSFSESQFGLRYIPTLSLSQTIGDELLLDAEASVRALGIGTFDSPDGFIDGAEAAEYRLWLRFSGARFGIRGGLQKINFGSALLLRPLMWFDRIDPRDPLQLTDGVYGLLGRYYFTNNANIWLWALYGNDNVKGWEVIPPAKNEIELGGRFQYPLGNGELALTYHHRKPDLGESLFSEFINIDTTFAEDRFAVDGKWDIEIGFWFEGALIKQNLDALPFRYRHFLTLGADYTLPLGSGLHLLAEHLYLALSYDAFETDEDFNFTAVLIDYSLGLLDRLRAIVYYDWTTENFSRYASWGRIYDNWSFYLNFFWNPESGNLALSQGELANRLGAGKGIQLMVVYNH